MGVLEFGILTQRSIHVQISHQVKVGIPMADHIKEIFIVALAVICSAPIVPTNAHISHQSNNIYFVGTKITFQCTNGVPGFADIYVLCQ